MGKFYNNKGAQILLNKYNFALVYIALLILRSVFFLQKYADIGCKICFLWGGIIVFTDFLKYKCKMFKINGSYIPLFLVIIYAIGILINSQYALYGGIKNMIYCILYFWILYALKMENSEKLFYKYVKRNNDIFIYLNMLIVIVSILTFVFGINILLQVDANTYRIGFWYNRLNGILNANMGTIFGMISIILSAINWVVYDDITKGKKCIYILNGVLQFIYYSLSGSRAATVCYVALGICILIFGMYPKWRDVAGKGKAIIKIGVIFIVLLVVGELLRVGCQSTMGKIPSMVTSKFDIKKELSEDLDLTEDNWEKNENDEMISFERVEDFKNGDITNQRMGMWKAAIKIVKQHPLFGISYTDPFDSEGNIKEYIDTSDFNEQDIISLKQADFYFHNGYIQILLGGGILYAIVFVALIMYNVRKYLKKLLDNQYKEREYQALVLVAAVLGALLIDNMVEAHLLFNGQDGIAALFWYLLGIGTILINILDSKKGIDCCERR